MNKLVVVTPSYNQGQYLEDCLSSVLNHVGKRQVEHVVMDGGSTDQSLAIIQKYADRLHYWQSQKDDGQYASIHEGFKKSDAEIMTWLNADDQFLPWTIEVAMRIFEDLPEVEWISPRYPIITGADGVPLRTNFFPGADREGFLMAENLPTAGFPSTAFIQQDGTFWRRSLWEKAGGRLDTQFKLAADFELWARFFLHAPLYVTDVPMAMMRMHGENQSTLKATEYLDEALTVILNHRKVPEIDRNIAHRRMLTRRIRGAYVYGTLYDDAGYVPVYEIRYNDKLRRYETFFGD